MSVWSQFDPSAGIADSAANNTNYRPPFNVDSEPLNSVELM